MNQVQALQSQISGLSPFSASLEMETLVATYLVAKAQLEQFVQTQTAAKGRIAEIIEETGITKWDTKSGKVMVPAPSVVVSYDATALDALAASNKTLARQILPHRREVERAGSIRITSK